MPINQVANMHIKVEATGADKASQGLDKVAVSADKATKAGERLTASRKAQLAVTTAATGAAAANALAVGSSAAASLGAAATVSSSALAYAAQATEAVNSTAKLKKNAKAAVGVMQSTKKARTAVMAFAGAQGDEAKSTGKSREEMDKKTASTEEATEASWKTTKATKAKVQAVHDEMQELKKLRAARAALDSRSEDRLEKYERSLAVAKRTTAAMRRNTSATNKNAGANEKDAKSKKKSTAATDKSTTATERNSAARAANRKAILFGTAALALFAVGVKQTVTAAADLETLTASFVSITGSAAKAGETVRGLVKFAADTPFQLPGIAAASRQLIVAKGSTEGLHDTLGMLGDIASTAQIPLNELAAIYSKAQNKGKIQAEELNQISERGIPIITELARLHGVNKEEIFKMGSEGKLAFQDLEAAFLSMTSEGGFAFEAMTRTSKTLDGRMSTLSDSTEAAKAEMGKFVTAGLQIKELVYWTNKLNLAFIDSSQALSQFNQNFLASNELRKARAESLGGRLAREEEVLGHIQNIEERIATSTGERLKNLELILAAHQKQADALAASITEQERLETAIRETEEMSTAVTVQVDKQLDVMENMETATGDVTEEEKDRLAVLLQSSRALKDQLDTMQGMADSADAVREIRELELGNADSGDGSSPVAPEGVDGTGIAEGAATPQEVAQHLLNQQLEEELAERQRLLQTAVDAEAAWRKEEAEKARAARTTARANKSTDRQAEDEARANENLERLLAELEGETAAIAEYERRKTQIIYDENVTRTDLQVQAQKALDQRLNSMRRQQLSMQLSSAKKGFGAITDALKDAGMEQKGIYKAMFAVTKAFSIAEGIINIQKAYTDLLADTPGGLGGKLGAIGALAGAVGGLMSTIMSTTLAFEHGGMIPAGTTGFVGEAGIERVKGPAIVDSARTTAGMLNQMQQGAGGGGNTTINVVNLPGQDADVTETQTQDGKFIEIVVRRAKDEIAEEFRSGVGVVSQAAESSYRSLQRG